jgi:iron(III) transport system ATP-binding protein
MDMALPMAVAGRAVRDAAATALSIEGVDKRFDNKFVALHHIDLEVRQGEMLCLLGPSGCGKTTLLRIIAGLETQTGGRILQNGRDISWLAPVKRDYGIVFQSYALFPNLTIAQNVAYGLVNRRRPKAEVTARTDELLTLVGLAGSGDKYPGQLSGGQQQRVALARALATSPRLLLLDEPLSALDALERIRLRGEIRRLQQQLGVTTIMVTHDQEEALSMADRIVVMNQGHIEQVGSPHDVYERPATPFVADFVGKVNVLPAVALGAGRFRVGRLELQCAPKTAPPTARWKAPPTACGAASPRWSSSAARAWPRCASTSWTASRCASTSR